MYIIVLCFSHQTSCWILLKACWCLAFSHSSYPFTPRDPEKKKLQFDGSTRAEDLPLTAPFARHEFGRSIGFSEEDEGRAEGKKKVGEVELVHVFLVDALDFERVILNFRQTSVALNKK